MENFDWSRFVKRIPVNGQTQSLYDLWTTQEGLERWFLRHADFKQKDGQPRGRTARIEPGDTYEWRWHGWEDEMVERGTILEVNGRDKIKFVFGKAGTVTVTIVKESGMPLVELVQDKIPSDEESKVNFHLGCQTGWVFYLTNLKSVVEGGLDLRNKRTDLRNVVSS
jgi:uncharacterized protein YndB with AHSA1/START domain